MHFNILLLLSVNIVLGKEQCLREKKHLRFYKTKSCYKSTQPITAWKNFYNVSDCIKYTREKNGFAFNFSPPELKNLTAGRWLKNCQVLGCPETKNSTTLILDPAFDYYTAYPDLNNTANSTCIKTTGLYKLFHEKKNYSAAVEYCLSIGADLADVLSEFKTNTLALLVRSLPNWYKAAYVGLDDIESEGTFRNPLGDVMDCYTYRAWSVGHPRPRRQKEDCVILSAEKTWRAINCKIKLPFICEYYPSQPTVIESTISKKNCTRIKNRRKRRQCVDDNKLYNLYVNSSRIDQCALLNDFD